MSDNQKIDKKHIVAYTGIDYIMVIKFGKK